MFDWMLALQTRFVLFASQDFRDQDGQGLTEYALILALIAVVAIVALKLLGGKVTSVLSTIGNSL
jgi:pilus assembly protein Flp/PilA